MRCTVEWLDANRLRISNNLIALEFDRRTSDTTWNYVWLRDPVDDTWHRSYNFGIDMIPRELPGVFISENLKLDVQDKSKGCHVRVCYEAPLVLYKNKRFTYSGKVIADYYLPWGKPYFDCQVHIESGDYSYIIHIINALWVENPGLPRRVLVPGQQIYAKHDVTIPIYKVPYVLFYDRTDRASAILFGFSEDNGFVRAKYGLCNYLPGHAYHQYALGQDYAPATHYTDGYNDICYQIAPELSVKEQQSLPRVRTAFLPFASFAGAVRIENDEMSLVAAKLWEMNQQYGILV
jgi:hypothetical protein